MVDDDPIFFESTRLKPLPHKGPFDNPLNMISSKSTESGGPKSHQGKTLLAALSSNLSKEDTLLLQKNPPEKKCEKKAISSFPQPVGSRKKGKDSQKTLFAALSSDLSKEELTSVMTAASKGDGIRHHGQQKHMTPAKKSSPKPSSVGLSQNELTNQKKSLETSDFNARPRSTLANALNEVDGVSSVDIDNFLFDDFSESSEESTTSEGGLTIQPRTLADALRSQSLLPEDVQNVARDEPSDSPKKPKKAKMQIKHGRTLLEALMSTTIEPTDVAVIAAESSSESDMDTSPSTCLDEKTIQSTPSLVSMKSWRTILIGTVVIAYFILSSSSFGQPEPGRSVKIPSELLQVSITEEFPIQESSISPESESESDEGELASSQAKEREVVLPSQTLEEFNPSEDEDLEAKESGLESLESTFAIDENHVQDVIESNIVSVDLDPGDPSADKGKQEEVQNEVHEAPAVALSELNEADDNKESIRDVEPQHVVPIESFPDEEPQHVFPNEPIPDEEPQHVVPNEPIPDEEPQHEVPYDTIPDEELQPKVSHEHIPDEDRQEKVSNEPIPDEVLQPKVSNEPIPDEEPQEKVSNEPLPDEEPQQNVSNEPIPDEEPQQNVSNEPIPVEEPQKNVPNEPIPDEEPQQNVPNEPIPDEELPKTQGHDTRPAGKDELDVEIAADIESSRSIIVEIPSGSDQKSQPKKFSLPSSLFLTNRKAIGRALEDVLDVMLQ